VRASLIAARMNRIAGLLCNPTPATQIGDLIDHIPEALKQVLAGEVGGDNA
jgi:NAD(P)H-hydrate repair Nnr-like enzyme with NAD(P)H-hydrate dehydratase domain